jgi:hypothetical protein
MTANDCLHSQTVYNDADGTIWCRKCGAWVLDEDRKFAQARRATIRLRRGVTPNE